MGGHGVCEWQGHLIEHFLPWGLGLGVCFLGGMESRFLGNKGLKVNFQSLLFNFKQSEAKLDAKATFKVRTNFEKVTFKIRS